RLMKLSAVMRSSVEIAVAGQNQPVGCFSITARLHRAKHVQKGYGASGRNFEKAAASVMPAGYANPIEVSIGTLHETCGASAIRIYKPNEHVVSLRMRRNCSGDAENQKGAGDPCYPVCLLMLEDCGKTVDF